MPQTTPRPGTSRPLGCPPPGCGSKIPDTENDAAAHGTGTPRSLALPFLVLVALGVAGGTGLLAQHLAARRTVKLRLRQARRSL